MNANRPPQRRGLGRGLGSLIPTGPADDAPRASAAAVGAAETEHLAPVEGAWPLAYALVALLLAGGCLLGLVARFRKVGSR